MPLIPNSMRAVMACARHFDSQGVWLAAVRMALPICLAWHTCRGLANGITQIFCTCKPKYRAIRLKGISNSSPLIRPNNRNAGPNQIFACQWRLCRALILCMTGFWFTSRIWLIGCVFKCGLCRPVYFKSFLPHDF